MVEHRLEYYSDKPTKRSDAVKGYVTVKGESDCVPYDGENAGLFSKSGQYCFSLSDSTIQTKFSTSSESERVEWVEHIRAAIDGVRHLRLDSTGTEIDELVVADRATSKRVSAAREGIQAIIELPRKIGELQKKPIVGRFGMKAAKTRFFI